MHSFSVEWKYAVPPDNTRRVVIYQRQDGPFRKDEVGGKGHYYVSHEILTAGTWVHENGSTRGALHNFEEAYELAGQRWGMLVAGWKP